MNVRTISPASLHNFFLRYDSLQSEATKQSSEKKLYERLFADHQLVASQKSSHIAAVAANQDFILEQRNRIELVSKHWFYGTTVLQPQLWLRGGCEGKISRAKVKLAAAEEHHPQLIQAVARIEPQVEDARSRLASQKAVYDRAIEASREVEAMQEEIVELFPTPELCRLKTHMTALKQQQKEAGRRKNDLKVLEHILNEAGALFRSAEQKVNDSMSLLGKAEETERRPPEEFAPPPSNVPSPPAQIHQHNHFDRHHKVRQHQHKSPKNACQSSSRQVFGPGGNTLRRCPQGCGFAVTWHSRSCCGACERGSPTHGPRCDRVQVISKGAMREHCDGQNQGGGGIYHQHDDRHQHGIRERSKQVDTLRQKAKAMLEDAETILQDGSSGLRRAVVKLSDFSESQQQRTILSMTPAAFSFSCRCCSINCLCKSKAKIQQLLQFIHDYRAYYEQQHGILRRIQSKTHSEIQALEQDANKCKDSIWNEKNQIFYDTRARSEAAVYTKMDTATTNNTTTAIDAIEDPDFIPTAHAVPMTEEYYLSSSYPVAHATPPQSTTGEFEYY